MSRLKTLLETGSVTIEALLRRVAYFFAWCMLALVLVVCFDILSRRFGWRLARLDSTTLQEIAWHLQAIVFCSWIGYAYTRNAHVRIDVFTTDLSDRAKCKLEIAGCILLAFPYLLVALPYAHEFFMVSFRQGEGSSSPTGLSHRWIIKGVLYLSFWGLLLANISVLLKNLAMLIGDGEQKGPSHV